jgi:hypothetical protein
VSRVASGVISSANIIIPLFTSCVDRDHSLRLGSALSTHIAWGNKTWIPLDCIITIDCGVFKSSPTTNKIDECGWKLCAWPILDIIAIATYLNHPKWIRKAKAYLTDTRFLCISAKGCNTGLVPMSWIRDIHIMWLDRKWLLDMSASKYFKYHHRCQEWTSNSIGGWVEQKNVCWWTGLFPGDHPGILNGPRDDPLRPVTWCWGIIWDSLSPPWCRSYP